MEQNEVTNTFLDTLENVQLTNIITAIIVFIVSFVITKLILQALKRLLPRVSHFIPETLHSTILGFVKVILYTTMVLATANAIGIPISALLALLSVIGLAISLAVQSLLKNIAGGMIILSSRPFSIGDFIIADQVEGTVLGISMMSTRLKTVDGRRVIIPNSVLYTTTLTNCTVSGERRIDLTFSASYDNAPEEVRNTVLEILKNITGLKNNPPPKVILNQYGHCDIEYTLWVWCTSDRFVEAKSEINEAIYYAFKKNNIEFTYPHMNIHIKE